MLKKPIKVALITGAARRIGAEIARILHANGINVVVHYHTSGKAAQALCASLNQQRKNSAISLKLDLMKINSLSILVKKAVNAWGRLDILVNNAAGFDKTLLGHTTEKKWDTLINSNLKAPFFLSQAAARHLTQHQGCIINIADIRAELPMKNYSVYCISKAGLMMLTKTLARELGPKIRVNAVSLGPTVWPEGKNTLSPLQKRKIISRTILKKPGDPREIAKAVLYLACEAEYMTGQTLTVDGGRSIVA